MVRGIGVDITLNSRHGHLGANTLRHILSPAELEELAGLSDAARIEFIASRFAAKEALGKALGWKRSILIAGSFYLASGMEALR